MARTTGSDGEKTQGAIRAAALELIARHGYDAVSMRVLAAEVGVQAAALYRYYATKEDLLFSLMHEHMVELVAAWETTRPASPISGGGWLPMSPTTSASTSSVGTPRTFPTWNCAASRTTGCRRS